MYQASINYYTYFMIYWISVYDTYQVHRDKLKQNKNSNNINFNKYDLVRFLSDWGDLSIVTGTILLTRVR